VNTTFVALIAGLAALLLATPASCSGADDGKQLAVGDPAPAFRLPGSDGKQYDSSMFTGEQAVVLAWFPKAFTGG
jgi:peroxiredoxin Q/BCP